MACCKPLWGVPGSCGGALLNGSLISEGRGSCPLLRGTRDTRGTFYRARVLGLDLQIYVLFGVWGYVGEKTLLWAEIVLWRLALLLLVRHYRE